MTKGYSDDKFWKKLFKHAKAAGREVVEKALLMFYAAQEPATPGWAKGVIYGALAYFILPTDTIPDFLPGVGYVDDLTALAAALATVAIYITPEVQEKASAKLSQWFG